jgi:hypothetical protein
LVRFTTEQEPFILVGSVSAAASNYQDFPIDGNEPDAELWRQNAVEFANSGIMYGGRAAFYAKGSLFGKYLLTASYDSKRNYRDQFYRDIDPSEQYPLYGDASEISYDAQSRSPLFVKLERNASSLVYGDFSTNRMNKTEFTAYNRTFNGLNAELKLGSHTLNAFATLTDRQMRLDEVRGEGISGYYYLSESSITEFSEKIVIQTRDKYHSETVIRSQEMVRFQDYTINYNDGSLMFKQPVPGMDANGNPVSIVVSYEYTNGKRESAIGGLRYEGTILNKLQIGATAVMEERASSQYLLYGADATLPFFKWLSLKGEYAASLDPGLDGDRQEGKAYKAELQFTPWKSLSARAYYRTVDSSFVNTSQSGRAGESGSEKYGFKAVLGNEKTGELSSEYYQQLNKQGTVNENSAEVFTVAYQRKFTSRGNFLLAYEDAERSRRSPSDSTHSLHSRLIRGNVSYKISNKISALLERDQNLQSTDQSKPTHTSIGLQYSITEKLGIVVKFRRLEGENAGNQIIVGLDSKVGENTQLNGKYEIGGALGENRNRASIGLKNKWIVSKSLTLNFAYENVSASDHFETPTTEHQSLSLAFEYLPEIPWKSTGKWEYRSGKDSRQMNYVFGTDFKILHGLSLIAKSVYSKINYLSAADDYVLKSDNQLGIAFRPERSDHYNFLAKAAYLYDENTHVQTPHHSERFILSTHHYWQPAARLEIGLQYAKRIVVDEEISLFSDKTVTDFAALRVEYDISIKWHTALDLRFIHLQPLNESKLGASLETGYQILRNMQLGIGYALLSFEDPDFSSRDYLYKNIYLTFHMKFSEDIFDWK